MKKNEVRIEVKTRVGQIGNPHLRNIHKDKFDLLVFVSLNNDYTIHFVGIVKNEDLLDAGEKKRIIFTNKTKLLFPENGSFVPHK